MSCNSTMAIQPGRKSEILSQKKVRMLVPFGSGVVVTRMQQEVGFLDAGCTSMFSLQKATELNTYVQISECISYYNENQKRRNNRKKNRGEKKEKIKTSIQ